MRAGEESLTRLQESRPHAALPAPLSNTVSKPTQTVGGPYSKSGAPPSDPASSRSCALRLKPLCSPISASSSPPHPPRMPPRTWSLAPGYQTASSSGPLMGPTQLPSSTTGGQGIPKEGAISRTTDVLRHPQTTLSLLSPPAPVAQITSRDRLSVLNSPSSTANVLYTLGRNFWLPTAGPLLTGSANYTRHVTALEVLYTLRRQQRQPLTTPPPTGSAVTSWCLSASHAAPVELPSPRRTEAGLTKEHGGSPDSPCPRGTYLTLRRVVLSASAPSTPQQQSTNRNNRRYLPPQRTYQHLLLPQARAHQVWHSRSAPHRLVP
jgi:hypothetical protein